MTETIENKMLSQGTSILYAHKNQPSKNMKLFMTKIVGLPK
ncbi:hypothetical protein D924_02851 [Enterococcus faecalis 06-MB-S-10]|nr:hypothetical protein D924_02851 [Enterococcus faecalis 06-MB-S-10]EPH88181.1 hypothetical protein D923_02172 [Enterococcus faecalis 06-MB-S-04]